MLILHYFSRADIGAFWGLFSTGSGRDLQFAGYCGQRPTSFPQVCYLLLDFVHGGMLPDIGKQSDFALLGQMKKETTTSKAMTRTNPLP